MSPAEYLTIWIVAGRYGGLAWFRDHAAALARLTEASTKAPRATVLITGLDVPASEVDVTSDAAITAWLGDVQLSERGSS